MWAKCEGGRKRAHEVSSGYAGYSFDETEGKMDWWESHVEGGTTCAQFEKSNPGGCAGCPHKGVVNSPLGLSFAEAPRPVEIPQVDEVKDGSNLAPLTPPPPDELEKPKDGFVINDQGQLVLRFESKKINGGVMDQLICHTDVKVAAILYDETTEIEQIGLRHRRPQAQHDSHLIVDPVEKLAGHSREQLMRNGIHVEDQELFKKYIREQTRLIEDTQSRTPLFTSFGLKKDGFFYGSHLYTPDRGKVLYPWGNNEVKFAARMMTSPSNARLPVWTDSVKVFFARGMEAHAQLLLAGFGGIFIKLFSSYEGGCLIALVSPDSGVGKSTALAAMLSIWGGKMLDLSKRDTNSSLWQIIANRGSVPWTFDEFPIDETTVPFIQTFDAGRDKTRSNVGGTDIRHPPANWGTIPALVSNQSVYHYAMRQQGGTDAAALRVMEFDAELKDVKASALEGDIMRETFFANCGLAGQKFAEHVFCTPGRWIEVQQMLHAAYKDIETKSCWKRHARFYLRALACMQVGGAIAHELKLLPEQPERYIDWAIEEQDYKLSQVTTTGKSLSHSRQALSDMITAMLPNTLVLTAQLNGGPALPPDAMPRGPIYARRETNTCRLYISISAFEIWLSKARVDVGRTVNDLHEMGIHLDKKSIDLGRGTTQATMSQPCYVFDTSRMTEESVTEETVNDPPPARAEGLSGRLH